MDQKKGLVFVAPQNGDVRAEGVFGGVLLEKISCFKDGFRLSIFFVYKTVGCGEIQRRNDVIRQRREASDPLRLNEGT